MRSGAASPSYVFPLKIDVDSVDESVAIPASSPMSIIITESSVHLSLWRLTDPKNSVVVDTLLIRPLNSIDPYHSTRSYPATEETRVISHHPPLFHPPDEEVT